MNVVIARSWNPVTYPWSLLDANESLMPKRLIKGKVERGAVIKGQVTIGRGTTVLSGAYIEGPVVIGEDCKIGPNCYIRPGSVIGNGCKIGNASPALT